MLKVNNITFHFDEKPIFTDFSASFETGKITAVIGTSGLGKTTLLNLLSGLLTVDSGTVENPFEKCAYIFQDPRLFPWLNALENVSIVCGNKDIAAKSLSLLFDGEDICDKYPAELSGGMKQRVSIARALSIEPDVIFMDEPFRGLDFQTKKKTQEILFGYLRENKKTGILVTHDSEDLSLCDSVLDLNAELGKILQSDN